DCVARLFSSVQPALRAGASSKMPSEFWDRRGIPLTLRLWAATVAPYRVCLGVTALWPGGVSLIYFAEDLESEENRRGLATSIDSGPRSGSAVVPDRGRE